MKNEFPTVDTIREFLLGRLDDRDGLESSLSERIFFDSELSEMADSIEDEIIEDYLDGKITAGDRRAIEGHFLRPAERRERLEFAKLLRDHFETIPEEGAKKASGLPVALPKKQFHFRTYGELAAATLLVVAGWLYTSQVRHGLQAELDAARKEQTQVQSKQTEEQGRLARLEKQLEDLPPVDLNIFGSQFRGGGTGKGLEMKTWTQKVNVQIGLRDKGAGDYNVRLENQAGQTIWSGKVQATAGVLSFPMPAQGITTGDYFFLVGSQTEPYRFHATVTK